jgi:hypothetical protein
VVVGLAVGFLTTPIVEIVADDRLISGAIVGIIIYFVAGWLASAVRRKMMEEGPCRESSNRRGGSNDDSRPNSDYACAKERVGLIIGSSAHPT